MAMKNPPHVGAVIRREVIEPLGLTVTEAAKSLGVGRQALSSLPGHWRKYCAAISPPQVKKSRKLKVEIFRISVFCFPHFCFWLGGLPMIWLKPARRRGRSGYSVTL